MTFILSFIGVTPPLDPSLISLTILIFQKSKEKPCLTYIIMMSVLYMKSQCSDIIETFADVSKMFEFIFIFH